MIRRQLSALVFPVVAACALSPGVASALPLDGPLISTTCSYSQLVSALQVEAPDLADQLAQRPQAQTKLQMFVALPVDQRKQKIQDALAQNPQWESTIDQKRNTPEGQQKVVELARVADTCHDYR